MTEEQDQTRQDDQASDQAASQPGNEESFVAPDMSYEEYLKLTNPGKSDEEIAKMIRKERRYTWLGRFQILAFIVIIILVLILVFTK